MKACIIFALITLLLSGCSDTIVPEGNFLNEERLATVVIGETTREQVLTNLGAPSARETFSPEDRWYYIGQYTQPRAFLAPLVYERRVIVLDFDQQGTVAQLQNLSLQDGQSIDTVSRRSPTPGTGLSVWQQLVGNIGRFPS